MRILKLLIIALLVAGAFQAGQASAQAGAPVTKCSADNQAQCTFLLRTLFEEMDQNCANNYTFPCDSICEIPYLAPQYFCLDCPTAEMYTGIPVFDITSLTDNDGDGAIRVRTTSKEVVVDCFDPNHVSVREMNCWRFDADAPTSGSGCDTHFGDRNDNDPCIGYFGPTVPSPCINNTCSSPAWPLDYIPLPGAPVIKDDDGDGIPHITLREIRIYTKDSSGNCAPRVEQQNSAWALMGDPDDGDACNPIPAACLGSPGCPAAGASVAVPGPPTIEDRDGDGLPAIYLHHRYWQVTSSGTLCTIGPVGPTTETPLPFPDPDDGTPNPVPNPGIPIDCTVLAGITFNLPNALIMRDRDEDGWHETGVQFRKYTVNPNCSVTEGQNQDNYLPFPDPDDTDPNIPGIPGLYDVVCGVRPHPCIILTQSLPGVCNIRDADKDNVPRIGQCETTLTCWSDLHCTTTAGSETAVHGDMNDNDACDPIANTRLSPNCQPKTVPGGARTYDSETDGDTFQDSLKGFGNWWWLLLLILAALIIHSYSKNSGRNKERRKQRMESRYR